MELSSFIASGRDDINKTTVDVTGGNNIDNLFVDERASGAPSLSASASPSAMHTVLGSIFDTGKSDGGNHDEIGDTKLLVSLSYPLTAAKFSSQRLQPSNQY